MRSALACLLLLTPLSAEPLHRWEFDTPAEAAGWRHKTNTRLTTDAPEPHSGTGAARLAIDASEFSFGWIHCPLPAIDLSRLAAVHGWFRAAAGSPGRLELFFCLASPGSGEMSYFGLEIAALNTSAGQWTEFLVPLAELRYRSGPNRRLAAGALTEADLLQFMVGTGQRQDVVVDLDGVELLDDAGRKELQPRLRRAALERLLVPGPHPGHPRLLLTDDQLARYRAKAAAGGETQAAYERLLAVADELLRTYRAADPLGALYRFFDRPVTERRAWSATMEGLLVNASWPIEVLAAAWRLTGERRYGDHAARALVRAAGQLTADEERLDQGFYYTRTFYVRALAFGYDWLYDLLDESGRRTVAATLLGFVQEIHADSQSGGWGARPLHRAWNWDPGLMSACGLGILALSGETRVGEQGLLFDCRRHLRDYLTLGIDADGCGHEGPSYLGYGIGAGVEFVEVLRRRGMDDLFCATNYRLIAPWLVSETLPDGRRWNNLSDCGHSQRAWPVYLYALGRLAELAEQEAEPPAARWPAPMLLAPLPYLAHFRETPGPQRLSYRALAGLMGWMWDRNPALSDAASYDGRTALAHVLFHRPVTALDDPGTVLPTAMHFTGRGLVVCRTGWGPDDFHLATEAGPHANGHDQADKGTFTLRAYGADLAIDSGYGNDGDHQASGSAFAHNVALIDGQGQPLAWGHNQSGGLITGFHHGPDLDWVRVDAREAWGVRYDRDFTPSVTTPVRTAERQFLFVRPSDRTPGYLVVYDDLDRDGGEHDYTWQWHIPASLRFETGGDGWLARPEPPPGRVLTTAENAATGSATFRFRLNQAGRYVLYGLVRAGGVEAGKSDSFFVSLDDGPALLWDMRVSSSFGWDAVTDREQRAGPEFELAAGEHRLVLKAREPQAELARWMILPAGAPPPLEPEARRGDGVAIELGAIEPGTPPLLLREPAGGRPPEVGMVTWLARPVGGAVRTEWYRTSQEGSHPRLWYTVKAVNPRFVAVMVPYRAGTPRPKVSPVGTTGVRVEWPEAVDLCSFTPGRPGEEPGLPGVKPGQAGGLTLDGAAGFVRLVAGKPARWALMDGTRMGYDNAVLGSSPARTVLTGP